jgi:hypothetical protein
MRAKHAASKSEYAARMKAHLESSRPYFLNADGSLNRARALREEHLSALKNDVVPRLRDALFARFGPERTPEVLRSFTRKNGEGGDGRLIEIVALMPSLKVLCEVMAARTMNPTRAPREQDFWDVEHAAIGTTHATAFASLDRGLMDIVDNRCEMPRRRGCRTSALAQCARGALARRLLAVDQDVEPADRCAPRIGHLDDDHALARVDD